MQYDYFNIVWKTLTEKIQEKILNIVEDSKGIIPYEKITSFNSLDSAHEKKFFFQRK